MKSEGIFGFLTQPASLPTWKKIKGDQHQRVFKNKVLTGRTSLKMDDELLRFSSDTSDRWLLRDAVRGTQIFGGTGSGKTSGSGKAIASSFLKKGMGGLVLCVKTDEAIEWEHHINELGRTNDLVRINTESSFGFNFLDWEQKQSHQQGGGLTTNITNFFMDIISMIDPSKASQSSDGFWDRSLRNLLNNAIVICSYLSDTLSLKNLFQVIELAPQGIRSVPDGDDLSDTYRTPVKAHPFDEICNQARARCPAGKKRELEESIHFFNQSFAALAEKTRSILVTSFTSMVDPLLREPLNSLFCETTVIQPEDCFDGKLIVVDLPIHAFQFVGKIANLIWKAAFKRACQRRLSPKTPVFLWIDESQYLVDPSDGEFQTTARSSLCCSVFLTQTISKLYAEFGNHATVDALMGCLHTKIFHQNGDYETNAWASKSIQKLPITVKSESGPKESFVFEPSKKTVSETIHWEEDVPGRVFLNLRSGGPENRYEVEGIIFYPGRKFSSGKPWIRATFDQKKI